MINSNFPVISQPLSCGSLEAYISWANRLPFLSEEEERSLAKGYISKGDVDGAKHLVLAHLRFVVRIAYQYSGYGLSVADLIQEGNIGLMKAVQRFNPAKGVRLVTFALYWVKAEIHEFVLRNWRIVKVATTKAQRKLFFRLRSFTGQRQSLSEQDASYVSEVLNVKVKDVRQMEMRMRNQDDVFDPVLDGQEFDGATETFLPVITDDRYSPHCIVEGKDQLSHRSECINDALGQLDERSQYIIKARILSEDDKKQTLQQLAKCLQISTERVRQVESLALKKMKKIILSMEL